MKRQAAVDLTFFQTNNYNLLFTFSQINNVLIYFQ